MSNKVKTLKHKKPHILLFHFFILFLLFYIKIDEKSYENIFIFYYIEYMTIKDWKYVKMNSVNPLYLNTNKVNG